MELDNDASIAVLAVKNGLKLGIAIEANNI
jgi:hypothetical protein